MRVAVVGAGPAGLAVTRELLHRIPDVQVLLLDRASRPDGFLRHGTTAGASALTTVAASCDRLLADPRVRFIGNAEVGVTLAWDVLRSSCTAVVLATGAPSDGLMPLAGEDKAGGVGTVTHLLALSSGSSDAAPSQLARDIDSVVFVGASSATIDAAKVLREIRPQCAVTLLVPEPDPRQQVEGIPLMSGAEPLALVGRHQLRALRIVARDELGHRRVFDLRAQLVLRPHVDEPVLPGVPVDVQGGVLAHARRRATRDGEVIQGVYVAGWASRHPQQGGSHGKDARAVVTRLLEDVPDTPPWTGPLNWAWGGGGGWSASAEVRQMLERAAPLGQRPLADYHLLASQADDE